MSIIENTADLSTLLEALLATVGNPSLLCILGSHLLIHLREAAAEGFNEGTSYRSKTFSAIRFEQPEGEESSEVDNESFLSK